MKTIKITLECELHSSLPHPVLSDGIVKVVQEHYGYIRELDKSINLGTQVLAVMSVDDYQKKVKDNLERIKNIWEDVELS